MKLKFLAKLFFFSIVTISFGEFENRFLLNLTRANENLLTVRNEFGYENNYWIGKRKNKLSLKQTSNYSELSKTTNANVKVSDNHSLNLKNKTKTMNDRRYFFLENNALKDNVKNIRLENISTFGYGLVLTQTERTDFSVDFGITYTFLNLDEEENISFFGYAVESDYVFRLTDALHFFDKFKFNISGEDKNRFKIETTTGFKIGMTDHLDGVISINSTYNNLPAKGVEREESIILCGVNLKF